MINPDQASHTLAIDVAHDPDLLTPFGGIGLVDRDLVNP